MFTKIECPFLGIDSKQKCVKSHFEKKTVLRHQWSILIANYTLYSVSSWCVRHYNIVYCLYTMTITTSTNDMMCSIYFFSANARACPVIYLVAEQPEVNRCWRRPTVLVPRKRTRVAGMRGAICPMPISSHKQSVRRPKTGWRLARSTSGWSRMCPILRTRATQIVVPDGR